MKNLIKKTAATTLSMIGILSMMPSALCAPEGEAKEPQNTNGRGHIDRFHAMIVGKYFNSVEDLANLQMASKKYEDIIGDYHFNPVGIDLGNQSNLLPNVETYRVGENEGNFVYTFPNDNIKKLVYLPGSFFDFQFESILKDNGVVNENFECINNWKRTFELYSENPIDGCRLEYTNGEKTIVFVFDPCVGTNGVLDNSLMYDSSLKTCKIEGKEYAAAALTSSKEVSIPNYITSIGRLAFIDCKDITSVNIPNSVTSIEGHAFGGCINLTSANIPESVTSIEECTFFNCKKLAKINIPNSVTSIGKGAFFGCKSLTNIAIPNSVTSIKESGFHDCYSLNNINIPNSVTSIGEYAFHTCLALTNIAIPESVTSIETGTFRGCLNLKQVTLPNSLTSIGDDAFQFCKHLNNINIPTSVTSIGDSAFNGCEELNHIEFNGEVYDNVYSFMQAFNEYRANHQ